MLARVDDRTFAAAFARLGYRKEDGWGVEDLSRSGWLLAGAPFIKHLALVEPLWVEACVAGAFRVLAVLDTGEALDLTQPAPMAGLGPYLYEGLSPAAYGQALARLHSATYRPDRGARIVQDVDDVGPQFRGRGISAVGPPQATRTDELIRLTFWVNRRHAPDGFSSPPVVALERWMVEARPDAPAHWESTPGYESTVDPYDPPATRRSVAPVALEPDEPVQAVAVDDLPVGGPPGPHLQVFHDPATVGEVGEPLAQGRRTGGTEQ